MDHAPVTRRRRAAASRAGPGALAASLTPGGEQRSSRASDLARALPIAGGPRIRRCRPPHGSRCPIRAALAAWAQRGTTLPALLLRELYARARRTSGLSDVALMPAATREALRATIVPGAARDPGFARAPPWDGTPVETGALARQQAHPLIAALRARDGNAVTTRMVARLAELAMLLQRLGSVRCPPANRRPCAASPWATAPGWRRCETARGLLLHQRAPRRRHASPTTRSWRRPNGIFIRQGALARGLARLAAARRGARWCATRGSPSRRSIRASPAGSRSAMHEMALAESMLRDRRGHGAEQRRGG